MFELKEGIPYYQNGRASEYYTFSPEDVRHTWLLQAGIGTERAANIDRWRHLVKSVEDIPVDGDILTWKLDVIQPDFSEYLSEDWTFGLISKAYWEEFGGERGYVEHPVGTGPWSFVEYVDDHHFLLEKNRDHYRKEPEFEELQFVWVMNSATVVAMLLTEEIHIGHIPSDFIPEVESRGFRVAKSTLPGYQLWCAIPWYMPEALDGTPTDNYSPASATREEGVRFALNVAIDRNLINDTFFGGDAIPSAVSNLAEWWDSFKPDWAPYPGPDDKTGLEGGWPYPYSLDMAREYLIHEGYERGFELTLYAPLDILDKTDLPSVGEAITAMWEELGIDAQLEIIEHEAILEKQAKRELEEEIFLAFSPVRPLSLSIGGLWLRSNTPYYEYPFITDWKELYDVTAHPTERKYMEQALGDFWYENHLSIPLLWVFPKVAYNPDILEWYEVNQLHFGPTRYHEYTVPIYR